MKVENWPLTRIKPYRRNPRLNDAAVDTIAKSITEFGFRQPIVVDREGVIICGHARLKAAQKLGLAAAPVHVAKELTPDQVKALRITDNKASDLSTWDNELLPIELADLQKANFDLGLTGFSADEMADLLAPAVAPRDDVDFIPDPPDEPITRRGDLWILGRHRLLCGDSSRATDLDRLLDGRRVHLVNTDPPYNVNVEPRSNNAIAAATHSAGTRRRHHQNFDLARDTGKAKATNAKLRAKDRPLANDFVSQADFDRLLRAWFAGVARALEPGHSFYIWGGYANVTNYPHALRMAGLYLSQAIIWVKDHPVLTRKDFMGDHEWCFYGWSEGGAHRFFGAQNISDVWPVKKVNQTKMVHLTEKPVELATRAMNYSSKAGERVLDLFGGSGSTLIAAEQLGRHALLMELDPLYCDVIVARWERFTGGTAKRINAEDPPEEPRRRRVTGKRRKKAIAR